MPATFQADFQAVDHGFRVRSNVEGMDEVIPRLFEGFRQRRPDGRLVTYDLLKRPRAEVPYELLMDGTSIQRVRNPGSMIDWVIGDVSRRALMETRRVVTVHAGVVSLDGRASVLPAAPGHGKSTTVAGLIRAGFSFLSDEAALVDPATDLVHPFPRPMMLSPASVRAIPRLRRTLNAQEPFRHYRYHVVPDDIRPGATGSPAPVAFVVAPRYSRGATTVLEPMARAEALCLLLQQSFNVTKLKATAAETLGRVLRDSRCFRLSIGDLDDAVAAIGSLYGMRDDEAGSSARERARSRS